MSFFHLILKEILHRKVNFFLGLAAITAAVALFVFFLTTASASKRETTRLMRDMGYNLRIIPKGTDMERFWAEGYSDLTISQDAAGRIAGRGDFLFNHILAVLSRRIDLRGRRVLLTGISPEISTAGKKKSSMIFSIAPGTVHVGYEIAESLGIAKGDDLSVMGRTFRVAACLAPAGSGDDVTLYAALSEVQDLLGMKGRINEIRALECVCTADPAHDPRVLLEKQLAEAVPEAQLIQIRNIAEARRRQRVMVERYFALGIPFVLVACAAWIGVLAMMNVRERRREVGLLRAIGHGSGRIAALFLGKAAAAGVIGAVLGFACGTILAVAFGPGVFVVTAKAVRPSFDLLGWSVAAAPLFAALSSLLPALLAVTEDPADILRVD